MPFIRRSLVGLAVLALIGCTPNPPASAPPAPPSQQTTTITQSTALLPAERPPTSLLVSQWRTDFDLRTVEWSEIRSGGPPKDGIPAIDAPSFEPVAAASTWLSPRDPVIVLQIQDDVRGYPLAILTWHEIVNDTVGDIPVAVTFCPLCNASIVFDRRFEDEVLDFGVSGLLRNSDMIMYDRQSETWWQQFTGQGLVGRRAGSQLAFHASQVISFADLAAQFPTAQVLARPALPRSYGVNPYVGYDTTTGRPFLFDGSLDTRLAATARVMGLRVDGTAIAYPFVLIAEQGTIHDTVADIPIVVWHKPGTASALDARAIAEGREVGSAAIFDRRVAGRVLSFSRTDDGVFEDVETGSRWTILGYATSGELLGTQLAPLIAFDHLWFAWAAFYPDTELYTGQR